MSTVSKSTARKIADQVVMSDWADELLRALGSAALEGLVHAGFIREAAGTKVVVELGKDVIFLRASDWIQDPVGGQSLMVRAVLCAPWVPKSLGDMGCFVGVSPQEAVAATTGQSNAFLATQLCIRSEADKALHRAQDVVASTVEHVRQAFTLASAEHVQATGQLLAAQLQEALAP